MSVTVSKYTFAKFNNNVTHVLARASGLTTIAAHTHVTVSSAGAVALKATQPEAGDVIVMRDYPTNGIYGDRYGRTKTPDTTAAGEVYGIILVPGDELIVEEAGDTGLAVGSLVYVVAPTTITEVPAE